MGGLSAGGGMSASGGASGASGSNEGGSNNVNMSKSFGATDTGSLISQNMIYAVIAVVGIGFFVWLMKKK